VFNESSSALRYTLDDVAVQGIHHVVLLGDYSDDGQTATMTGLRTLLDDYARRHGMQFYAVPGNHDIFGPGGRHRSKRFLNARGGHDLITSNPAREASPMKICVVLVIRSAFSRRATSAFSESRNICIGKPRLALRIIHQRGSSRFVRLMA
jgi:3',5'-cyclic AMP phosphodiesterase CpdA